MRYLILLFILCVVFCDKIIAQPAEVVLSGKVLDTENNKPLEGATIYIQDLGKGTTSNLKGEYSLKIPVGKYEIKVSYVGYISISEVLDVNRSISYNFKLDDNIALNEVVVTTTARNNITAPVVGTEKLSSSEIKRLPAMMGEVDVIKAVQLLPGVQSTSDGGSGFSVRGSAPDQNLILFDNSTIYNASHLMGIFSVFNNDVVSGLDLYKGDIPVKYGGRLASLLDIRTKNDIPERLTLNGGVGLISSRLTLETPIGSKTSVLLGGRRSYADLFMRMTDDFKDTYLYFYDLNAKVNHSFSDKDKLELSVYHGKDMFGAETQKFNYTNSAASLTYSHNYSSDHYSKYSFNISDYSYGVYSGMKNNELSWESAITDYSLKADYSSFVSDMFGLSYGASTTMHKFKPGLVKNPHVNEFKLDNDYSFEYSLYLSNEMNFNDKFIMKYGLRFTSFSNVGPGTAYIYDEEYEPKDSVMYKKGDIYNTYYAWEPRIGFVYVLNDDSSVKLSAVHNEQFIQLANNSAAGSPMDIWFTANNNIKPQKMDMISGGYFRNFNNDMYETSVEVYYKRMSNVIDFVDHAQLMLNKYLDGEVRTGTGRAYGMEVMVKKNKGKLNGFVNYTLSRSERTIAGVNEGKTYLAPYDKTHCVNVVGNYEISPKHMLSATWIYATGMPTTYPVGRFEVNGEYFPIYSDRNEYRKPDYHRLDLAYTYTPKPNSGKRYKGEWVFSVFNAYGRKNPWTISYNQESGGAPYAEMVYMFGVLPSVTYNFKF